MIKRINRGIAVDLAIGTKFKLDDSNVTYRIDHSPGIDGCVVCPFRKNQEACDTLTCIPALRKDKEAILIVEMITTIEMDGYDSHVNRFEREYQVEQATNEIEVLGQTLSAFFTTEPDWCLGDYYRILSNIALNLAAEADLDGL